MILKNYDEIFEKLEKTLKDLDFKNPNYQVDIYLYVDEEGKGTLDTFTNVGGNSWLNDDHICLYQRTPSYEELWINYDIDTILAVLNKTRTEVFEELKQAKIIDEDENMDEIEDGDFIYYIEKNSEYTDALTMAEIENSSEGYYNTVLNILESKNIKK